jgi:hypothetical protein
LRGGKLGSFWSFLKKSIKLFDIRKICGYDNFSLLALESATRKMPVLAMEMRTMRRFLWRGKVCGLSLLLMLGVTARSANVWAGTITYTGTQSGSTGTGFGSIDNVLTVHNNGTESGGVSWSGSKDVLSGDATNQSQTLTAAYLTSATGTNISWSSVTGANFEVIFQVDQSGKSTLDLHKFQLDFFTNKGAAAIASVVYTNSTPSSTGLGGNGVGTSGYVFNVHLTGTEASTFFGTGTDRLGMSVPSSSAIDNTTNGGPENFYVAAGGSVTASAITSVTPEPASLTLIGIGIAGIAGYGWRKRKAAATAD